MSLLTTLHGEMRWLVLLVALIALVKYTLGLVQKSSFKGMDRGLMSAYTGLMDLNLLLGLIIILFGGGLNTERIEHAGTMLVAVGVAHYAATWRNSPSSQKKFRNNLVVIVVSLALVVTGVLRLRGGWIF